MLVKLSGRMATNYRIIKREKWSERLVLHIHLVGCTFPLITIILSFSKYFRITIDRCVLVTGLVHYKLSMFNGHKLKQYKVLSSKVLLSSYYLILFWLKKRCLTDNLKFMLHMLEALKTKIGSVFSSLSPLFILFIYLNWYFRLQILRGFQSGCTFNHISCVHINFRSYIRRIIDFDPTNM